MTFLDPRIDPVEVSLSQGNKLRVSEEVLTLTKSLAIAKSIIRVIFDRLK